MTGTRGQGELEGDGSADHSLTLVDKVLCG